MARADRGHAALAHTADTAFEAWGPTAAACYEEAVAAFVDIFADTEANPVGSTEAFHIGPGQPEELLVLLLEEVVFRAEARGHVVICSEVEARRDRLVGTLTSVPIEDVDVIGPIPKGVSYSDLEFGPTASGWYCRATVNV